MICDSATKLSVHIMKCLLKACEMHLAYTRGMSYLCPCLNNTVPTTALHSMTFIIQLCRMLWDIALVFNGNCQHSEVTCVHTMTAVNSKG